MLHLQMDVVNYVVIYAQMIVCISISVSLRWTNGLYAIYQLYLFL